MNVNPNIKLETGPDVGMNTATNDGNVARKRPAAALFIVLAALALLGVFATGAVTGLFRQSRSTDKARFRAEFELLAGDFLRHGKTGVFIVDASLLRTPDDVRVEIIASEPAVRVAEASFAADETSPVVRREIRVEASSDGE